jgi:hypothetical protein
VTKVGGVEHTEFIQWLGSTLFLGNDLSLEQRKAITSQLQGTADFGEKRNVAHSLICAPCGSKMGVEAGGNGSNNGSGGNASNNGAATESNAGSDGTAAAAGSGEQEGSDALSWRSNIEYVVVDGPPGVGKKNVS